MCADAKVSLDDNALYRHPEPVCYVMKPVKIHAKAVQRSLILIMSRWTEISAAWSMVQGWLWQPWTSSSYTVNNPQTSGCWRWRNQERVSEAFRLIVSDSKVKAILVNIFGGIVRCDMIARAIIHALNEASITLPVVVRLSGNNAAEGQRLLAESGLTVEAVDSLDDAAKRIIALLN